MDKTALRRRDVTQNTTVLIVEQQPIYRIGIKATIENETGYQVIGETGDGATALLICKDYDINIALIDMSLPNESGIELICRIKEVSPQTRIMITSLQLRIEDAVEAFKAGALGYVVKECASDTLLTGLDAILREKYFFNGSVSSEAGKDLVTFSKKEERRSNTAYGDLTSREQEIASLLAEGIPRKTIAEQLFLSPKTIDNHKTNIMRKLSINSQLELVRYAAKVGLIDVELWKVSDGRRQIKR